MINKLRNAYRNSTLATKIRYSYFALIIPLMGLTVVCLISMYYGNRQYADMIESAIVASDFSLDFKNDFDYETYLVVVENKTIEESELNRLLDDANRIVVELKSLPVTNDNHARLDSAAKYLDNLQKYIDRIAENLEMGNMYEQNMLIWENDVQIVTALLSETLNEYIFYEIRDMQLASERLEHNSHMIVNVTAIAAIILMIVTVVFSYHISKSITRPIYEVSEVTRQVSEGDLSVRTNIVYGDEVKQLGDSLNQMIDKIEQLLDQVTVEQTRLRHAELELLQAQINPHFLYNTLDTIVWLAEAGEQDKVVSMVGSLSKFFRTSLNQGKDNISIGEELQHARSYLEIQQVRYQDILTYDIDVPESLYSNLIPKITIQPLVENALYHGIKNKRGLGCIKITGLQTESGFDIIVTDDGIGMSEDRLEQIRDRISNPKPESDEIFGLYNVNERIRLRFGDQYGISIKSQYGVGTEVRISLPINLTKNE